MNNEISLKVENTKTAISVDEFDRNGEERVHVTKVKLGDNVANIKDFNQVIW